MDNDQIKQFIDILLNKQILSITEMESFGDEGANTIARAKLNSLIAIVLKDSN